MTFSYGFDNENIKNCHSHVRFILLDIILARWRRPVASSKALDLFHWTMHAVLYQCITAAMNMATFLGVFICWLLFVCLLLWRPLGQYGASSHPMPASSGFRSSPGHAALGNDVCIAPVHCRGHQNGWQTRCICLPSSILPLTITIAKDHVMVH